MSVLAVVLTLAGLTVAYRIHRHGPPLSPSQESTSSDA